MFGFLTIPDAMKKQFTIPSGIRISRANAELRKVKTLGGSRKWRALQPGELLGMRPLSKVSQEGRDYDEDDDDLCGLPTGGAEGPPFERLILWTDPSWIEQEKDNDKHDDSDSAGDEGERKESVESQPHRIEVVHDLARKLRPHQREGVQFLFECTMGLRGFNGEGCILADDMGLGKTLMSIVLLWTLLKQGFKKGESAVRKVVIACPTSLVGNWENEINKWLDGKCTIYAVKTEPKKIIKNFVQERRHSVLIVSYETQRLYQQLFQSKTAPCNSCDLLICDEAHKLKNADSGLTMSLNKLPAKKRILLSGTPMQNELTEFFNMVDFCNPMVLGSKEEFRKKYERPILRAREPDATDKMREKAVVLQNELSTIVNEFILKRGNILNARHLPPKLTQFVCCRLSPIQEKLYDALLGSKTLRHIRDGIQKNALNSILYMQHICAHPQMILNDYNLKKNESNSDMEELEELVKIIDDNGGVGSKPVGGGYGHSSIGIASAFPLRTNRSGLPPPPSLKSNDKVIVDPEQSGKILVLFRMLQTLRAMKEGDRIVIVANTTSVLDIIEELCKASKYPVLRLDGTTPGPKRTKLVDEFNNQFSNSFVFLLSSKAGGCGINLIGGNRLVLFDPDWNPSSDKQAAGRIWREGQKKKCYIYRFMSTGTIEEKIIQRQLFKQSLQDIVDDRDAVNNIPQNELKNLFIREVETRSDTHDTLSCTRCKSVKAKDRSKGAKTLNVQQVEECQHFLSDYIVYAKDSCKSMERNANIPPGENTVSISDLETLLSGLSKNDFHTLPQFSKKLRNIIWSIQEEIEEVFAKDGNTVINIYEEFLNRWDDCVKMLTAAGRLTRKCNDKADNEEAETFDAADEFVPQEGCPEDEDFNRWSHHTSVDTCDDEALRRACQDNDVVSFVFGLEVNWTLLQSKQEEQREEEEKKKKKAKEDLDALNKKRQMEKENSFNLASSKQEKMVQKKKLGEVEVNDDDDSERDLTKDDNITLNDNGGIRHLSEETKRKKKKKKRHRGISDSLTTLHGLCSDSATVVGDNQVDIDGVSKDCRQKVMHEIRKDDDDDDDDFVPTSEFHNRRSNSNILKNKKRVIDDDDDDDDDENGGDNATKNLEVTESLLRCDDKRTVSDSSSAFRKEKKLPSSKEREIQIENDFRALLGRLRIFDTESMEGTYELVDFFEALLMCVGNFASFEWVKWNERSISDLSALADQLVNMLENFPGIKPEKKLLIRPTFQSGSFATTRINRFKDFTSHSSVRLSNNLSTIYKEIGRDDLPRALSGPMKSCGYKHSNLPLLSNSESLFTKCDDDTLASASLNGDRNDHIASQSSMISSSCWDCPQCTYHNEEDALACEICGVKRRRRKRDTPSASQSQIQKHEMKDTGRLKPKKPKNVPHQGAISDVRTGNE